MHVFASGLISVASGSIFFKGQDLLKKSEKELRKIRGKNIAYILQTQ